MLGQDYWVNTILDRPVSGLEGSPAGYSDVLMHPSFSTLGETGGALSAVNLFIFLVFISIVFFITRKFNEWRKT